MYWNLGRLNIETQLEKSKMEYIKSIDFAELSMEMLDATEKKYRYINHERKLDKYTDFIAFQKENNRYRTDIIPGRVVTYDNILVAPNKFLEWLFNTNYVVVNLLRRGCAIELNLITKINGQDGSANSIIKIKITTKSMESRGFGELTELRFILDHHGKARYEEIGAMYAPLGGSFREKEMDTFLTFETIKFMQEFIKKTRELIP